MKKFTKFLVSGLLIVGGLYGISQHTNNETQVAEAATPTTLYLDPNSNWEADSARFAAYFFEGESNTWVSMTDSDCDTIYEVTVPSGFTSVIFCRMDPSTSTNNWNNKWNQTGDLTIPTNGNNTFTVTSGLWDGATSTWSKTTFYEDSITTKKYTLTSSVKSVSFNDNTITVDENNEIYLSLFEVYLNNIPSTFYKVKVTTAYAYGEAGNYSTQEGVSHTFYLSNGLLA